MLSVEVYIIKYNSFSKMLTSKIMKNNNKLQVGGLFEIEGHAVKVVKMEE